MVSIDVCFKRPGCGHFIVLGQLTYVQIVSSLTFSEMLLLKSVLRIGFRTRNC